MEFENKLHVYHKNKYLFTIHFNNWNFKIKDVVKSQQGNVNNFSFQFEWKNKFFSRYEMKDYPEMNVHVQYENPGFANVLSFPVKIRGPWEWKFSKTFVCNTDTVGDLKKKCSIHPEWLILMYRGIQMDNDDLPIGLYGINQPCDICKIEGGLGRPSYQITRQPPQTEFPMDGKLTCCVCLDKPSRYMFSPCNHLCICDSCKDGIGKECPICKGTWNGLVKVYY